nr:DUF6325 family protein [Promineifilum sp.]
MSDEMEFAQELGPIEYVVFAFDGNEFNGAVIPALREIVAAGTVRIIDMAVIHKDEEGRATIVEITELDSRVAAGLEVIRGEFNGL